MRDYDFSKVFEPLEFQDFARDMIQVREKIFIESFAEGKDLGIDGRCVQQDGDVIIFQAKRLSDANRSILSMARTEKNKIDKLVEQGMNVKRYILALSGDISPLNKDAALQIFSPYIAAPEDIITGKDLNNYLNDSKGKYQSVEEKYFKLWIQNTKTLKRVLYEMTHTPLVKRSEMKLNEAIENAHFFVEVEIYKEALKKLQKNRVLIISGEPGVGKTTLANQVALYYYAKHQFQYIYVSTIEDFYTVKDIEGKVVIIFDDFWGSNGFDIFGKGMNTKDLISHIEYIQKTNDRVLIMTTREYILEQGLKKNEDFRMLVKINKLDCHIEQYSKTDKLRIYFGHLRNSSLTWKQVNSLMLGGEQIIESPNYNPRVIADFIKYIIGQTTLEDYVESLYHYLDCPVDFWKKIFIELSQEAQTLYWIMAIMPLPIEIKVLKECYYEVLRANGKLLEWQGFSETITELERTVVRTDIYNQDTAHIIAVTYQNPSAKDFILGLIRENLEKYNDILLKSCNYFSQCVEYLKMLKEMSEINDLYETVMERAIEIIDSDSISFFDNYKFVLRRNKERNKFYSLYRTEREYEEVGFGRYMQLLLMYDKNKCFNLRGWFEEIFVMIVRNMERYPEAVLSEDLSLFPNVVVNMVEQGISDKPEEILDIYMNSLMRNRMELNGRDFENLKEIWKSYKAQNKEKIALYLSKFYQAELCQAAVRGKIDEFDFWLMRCEDDFEEYGLQITEQLKQKIKQYDSWLADSDTEEHITDEELKNTDYQKRNIQEIQRDFKEEYLEEILPAEVDDIDEWFSINAVPESIQSVIEKVKDEWNEYWTNFMYDEDSLEFLVMFVSRVGYLDEKILNAVGTLSSYIETECNSSKEQLLRLLMYFDSPNEKECIRSKIEIEEVFFDSRREEIIQWMIEAKILINRHHWYRLSNWQLLFSIYINCLRMIPEIEINGYYQSVFEVNRDKRNIDEYELSLVDILIKLGISWKEKEDTKDLFLSTLNKIDPEKLKRYALIPRACSLYDQLYADSDREIIRRLIDEIQLEFILDKSCAYMGGEVRVDDYFYILESISDFNLLDIIPEEFTEEQIKILKGNGLLDSNYSTITLKQLDEMNLLDGLGIYDKLISVWKNISILKMEGENNG